MRTVGGAHRGLNLWLLQRASAVVMALCLPVFIVYAGCAWPLDFVAWRALFLPTGMKIATLLCVAALLVHAWIGLREICIDYLHALRVRLPVLFTFAVLDLACLVWAADILWNVK